MQFLREKVQPLARATARTGAPAEHARLSAVVLPGATESDALSTALLTAPELMESLVHSRPELRGLVVRGTGPEPLITAHGLVVGECF